MTLRPNDKEEKKQNRRNRYKKTVNGDEGRRRREDEMIEIRKNKREENLSKKRRDVGNQAAADDDQKRRDRLQRQLQLLPSMVEGIRSQDIGLQFEATTQIKKLLAIERNPHIDEVIGSGLVPWLVKFLERDDFPLLQFHAAWALTNIASGTSRHTKVVIDQGAIPMFVRLLGSPDNDVREQVVWALGNVAGDSSKCRDFVLGHGALPGLLSQFNEKSALSMLRNATWTLSNFCRGKPQPDFEQVKVVMPYLAQLIHTNDVEVITDACWALSYLSDGKNARIQAIIDAGVCPRLVQLLLTDSAPILVPALRTVGNIVSGKDIQTQTIIDYQGLPCLLNLLTQNPKKSITKEACWAISNITAGSKELIQAVIDVGIFRPLVGLCLNGDFVIKKEAAWAISNATCGGSHDQIRSLVNQGCIKPLCDLLVCPDPKVIIVCLEALENILKVGEVEKDLGNTNDINICAQMIDEADGVEKIENLQTHDNTEVYEMAVKILETYWLEEGQEEQVPSGGPSLTQPPGFGFGNGHAPAAPSGGFKFG
ncbi:OLC1v1009043C1 [Oldenlandia corymbosa var. corymbosa]|uniref:Importin subunit alpha n=1 Tax=Oldenlandia corymbosa var. corymbosa TaxID=529605 RepID=A0AAV1DMZ7_OLDCO|nr:OLC1v1009043C1 [Oldenlandia corymbosa var. corymbosa]